MGGGGYIGEKGWAISNECEGVGWEAWSWWVSQVNSD